MDHETKHMLYEPGERIDEYWNIQFQYLVDDGMITTEEEKAYFQSSEYRDVLKAQSSYVASARTAEYYKSRPCAAKVESAARIFAEYLMAKE